MAEVKRKHETVAHDPKFDREVDLFAFFDEKLSLRCAQDTIPDDEREHHAGAALKKIEFVSRLKLLCCAEALKHSCQQTMKRRQLRF